MGAYVLAGMTACTLVLPWQDCAWYGPLHFHHTAAQARVHSQPCG